MITSTTMFVKIKRQITVCTLSLPNMFSFSSINLSLMYFYITDVTLAEEGTLKHIVNIKEP
jgi:hypothetical protein